ncbi:Sodium:neurotransmitter symporter family protein [Toxoplasma gondii CAST]|uniref:Sodium:neurotransmitter symporter family protein n=1 Tax=Toxoplasma gondii CAST TaxID=943122 RepID=A0A425I271_TOXGO|nr:Sodium:neurotransmitter symporter family protein [Toxoplasma gondii CAST]
MESLLDAQVPSSCGAEAETAYPVGQKNPAWHPSSSAGARHRHSSVFRDEDAEKASPVSPSCSSAAACPAECGETGGREEAAASVCTPQPEASALSSAKRQEGKNRVSHRRGGARPSSETEWRGCCVEPEAACREGSSDGDMRTVEEELAVPEEEEREERRFFSSACGEDPPAFEVSLEMSFPSDQPCRGSSTRNAFGVFTMCEEGTETQDRSGERHASRLLRLAKAAALPVAVRDTTMSLTIVNTPGGRPSGPASAFTTHTPGRLVQTVPQSIGEAASSSSCGSLSASALPIPSLSSPLGASDNVSLACPRSEKLAGCGPPPFSRAAALSLAQSCRGFAPSPREAAETAETRRASEGCFSRLFFFSAVSSRARWRNKEEYILTSVCYGLGLGNLWRFPYLCYANGAGAFLIAYFVSLLLVGFPMFLLESVVGQKTQEGSVRAWKSISPVFAGIGLSSVCLALVCAVYYNVVLSWAFFFFFHSFSTSVPWIDSHALNPVDAVKKFFLVDCLQKSESISGGAPAGLSVEFNFHLLLCLFVAWLLSFLTLWRSLRPTGKAVLFTSAVPCVGLLLMVGRGLSLPGSSAGLRYYFSPQWHLLLEPRTWAVAGSQVFFSLGIAWGSLVNYASFNSVKNNFVTDAIVVTSISALTAFLAGLGVFAVIGHMAEVSRQPIEEVARVGSGVVFVAYPFALSTLPGAAFFSVCFFALFICLGLNSQFAMLEVIMTAWIEAALFRALPKSVLALLLSLPLFLLGIVFVSPVGIYWVDLLDTFAGTVSLSLVALCEVLAVVLHCDIQKLDPQLQALAPCSTPSSAVVSLLPSARPAFLPASPERLPLPPLQLPNAEPKDRRRSESRADARGPLLASCNSPQKAKSSASLQASLPRPGRPSSADSSQPPSSPCMQESTEEETPPRREAEPDVFSLFLVASPHLRRYFTVLLPVLLLLLTLCGIDWFASPSSPQSGLGQRQRHDRGVGCLGTPVACSGHGKCVLCGEEVARFALAATDAETETGEKGASRVELQPLETKSKETATGGDDQFGLRTATGNTGKASNAENSEAEETKFEAGKICVSGSCETEREKSSPEPSKNAGASAEVATALPESTSFSSESSPPASPSSLPPSSSPPPSSSSASGASLSSSASPEASSPVASDEASSRGGEITSAGEDPRSTEQEARRLSSETEGSEEGEEGKAHQSLSQTSLSHVASQMRPGPSPRNLNRGRRLAASHELPFSPASEQTPSSIPPSSFLKQIPPSPSRDFSSSTPPSSDSNSSASSPSASSPLRNSPASSSGSSSPPSPSPTSTLPPSSQIASPSSPPSLPSPPISASSSVSDWPVLPALSSSLSAPSSANCVDFSLCFCLPGWGGSDCSSRLPSEERWCPENCNADRGHGACNARTGLCACATEFRGPSCRGWRYADGWPDWSLLLGWLIALGTVFPVPLVMLAKTLRKRMADRLDRPRTEPEDPCPARAAERTEVVLLGTPVAANAVGAGPRGGRHTPAPALRGDGGERVRKGVPDSASATSKERQSASAWPGRCLIGKPVLEGNDAVLPDVKGGDKSPTQSRQ